VVEIPSGTQDGRAVEDLLRRMHLRPISAAAAGKSSSSTKPTA